MEEEAEEDALGYLTLLLLVPPCLFDLFGGVTPLLQVGLSAPGWGVMGWKENKNTYYLRWQRIIFLVGVFKHFHFLGSVKGSFCIRTTGVQVCVAGSVAGAEAG